MAPLRRPPTAENVSMAHINNPEPAEDYGASGAAAQARPSRLVRVDGRLRGAAQRNADPIYARRYQDAHLVDRLWRNAQLSDRQHEAARRVLALHAEARVEPVVTASYQPRGFGGFGGGEGEEPESLTEFRRLLGDINAGSAWLLHAMCQGEGLGLRRLGSLQAALDDLADRWGIERVGVGYG